MITKEDLLKAKATVNEAAFKIKKAYSNSPTAQNVFFVVEGKDDVPFYATNAEPYLPTGWKVNVINATNRRRVIDTYKSFDWTIYSKDRILFFVDRDLSDYTGEDTPKDSNVYVTEKYSIENELCTLDTFNKALKFYYDLLDIDDTDEQVIETFYTTCWDTFETIAEQVMAQILYWKLNSIASNYANFKIQNTFKLTGLQLELANPYSEIKDVIQQLCLESSIPFIDMDFSPYIKQLKEIHTPCEFIRGKYVVAFFSKAITYLAHNSTDILPSKKRAKDKLSLGYEDVVLKLCGIMKVPESLDLFFREMKERLSTKAS